jgi:hypothetical protein
MPRGTWPARTREPDLMSSSEAQLQPTTTTTEILLVTGERCRVEGDVKSVERMILDAARGSILQLAWLIEADTGDDLAVNPEHVIALRGARAEAPEADADH